MPKQLPFENVDFAAMARNIDDPGQPAPLPKQKSTIAHDVMELAKTGIETYGKVKEKQIDDRRKAELNTINAVTAAFNIGGKGMRIGYGMFGKALSPEQVDEINRATAAERASKDQSFQIELYRAGLPSSYGQKSPTPKNPMRIVDNLYRQVMYNPQTGTSTYARDPQDNILYAPPPPSGVAAADQAAARQAALMDKYSKMLVKSIAKKDQFGFPIVVDGEPQYTDNWNEKQYQALIKQKLTPETKLLVDALRAQYYDETAEKYLIQPKKQGEGLTGRVEE